MPCGIGLQGIGDTCDNLPMQTISIMSANFVAREVNYDMRNGWSEGDSAAQEWFQPLATYRARFSALLDEIVDLGFNRIDLWTSHLHWKWATPAHIAIARDCLRERNLAVASYAGHFGSSADEVTAACLLCRELGIPILGGFTELLQEDRPTLVHILRQHGLIFALENHPELSMSELLKKVGSGDDDVIGITFDSGWFATQGADVLDALKAGRARLKHVHLKDVRAPAIQPTGYPFKDIGHETCKIGEGIVPVQEILKTLIATGYRGGISIEHEPESERPHRACEDSRKSVLAWLNQFLEDSAPSDPVRVAIVGCGNIAGAYASQINSYPHVQLLGAFDIDLSRAEELSKKYGGRVYASLEDVLADPSVEVVVNLSIHHVHAEIIEQCLLADKHVHTEKPLALDSKTAWGLVELAETRGLRLSSAPTTWLGEAQLSAWRRIQAGEIGIPRVVYAEVNWGRIESWHPNPAPFYAVGPVFDVAVYPLTLLTAWFGPVTEVISDGGVLYRNRQTKDGTPFEVVSPDWTATVLRFKNGPVVRLTASFYVGPGTTQAGLEVHGDAGTIRLDRWDVFNSSLYLHNAATENQTWKLVPDTPPAEGIEFARGLSDLAQAMRSGRPHLTTGAHAAHIVEVMEAILHSIVTKKSIAIAEPKATTLPASLPT